MWPVNHLLPELSVRLHHAAKDHGTVSCMERCLFGYTTWPKVCGQSVICLLNVEKELSSPQIYRFHVGSTGTNLPLYWLIDWLIDWFPQRGHGNTGRSHQSLQINTRNELSVVPQWINTFDKLLKLYVDHHFFFPAALSTYFWPCEFI